MWMFYKVITEPAILIITGCFLFCMISVLVKYFRISKNLKSVYNTLKTFNKNELSYRYKQLDEFMSNNAYMSTSWEDFKKALIFPNKIYSANKHFDSEIYLTMDSAYFFNEDSMVFSNINGKLIQAMPTLLTGLGPFFTFLKMAIAFSAVNLTSANAEASINSLVQNIQIAALCSVFAVGYSLLFMATEKISYSRTCKKYCLLIQKEFIRLFDVCSGEGFLLDLVGESRLQGFNNEKLLKSLPDEFAKSMTKSVSETMTPYLENILYSLNKLNETMDKGNGGDVVDKLF
jgi:hypothetical protein